jgi:Flp pilus assembly protein TadD
MKRRSVGIVSLWLAACAQLPPAAPPDPLLHDAWFAPPSQAVDVGAVFALSAPMQRYVDSEISRLVRERGRQGALVTALYERGLLRLEYDATVTRTAAQAFDARLGNCLSLVIMTASFAKALGIEVQYQRALNVDDWGRLGDLFVRSGHVNITLGRRLLDRGNGQPAGSVTIDFLPAEDITGMRVRPITEATVLAMFMNNRAAESLAQGALDEAYWFAREAVRQDPTFASAFNTLGVVYLRRGRPDAAELALRRVLADEPDNPRAIGNLAVALERQGRSAEAAALRRQLARVEPEPPFHYFNLGVEAAQRGDWSAARDLFAREVRGADFNPEFHYWLARANWHLGDFAAATRELTLAMQSSTTSGDRDRYASKLAWIESQRRP